MSDFYERGDRKVGVRCEQCNTSELTILHPLHPRAVLLCTAPEVLAVAPGPRWAAAIARTDYCLGRFFTEKRRTR